MARKKRGIFIAGLAAAAHFLLAVPTGTAAPEAELWPRWHAHDPDSAAAVDHDIWDEVLRNFVVEGADGINRVRYRSIDADARQKIDGYITGLEHVVVSGLDRAEQMAFWINLYNAATVRLILDHYPIDTIRDIDISPGLFADGPWQAKLVAVEDVALSLDDIEHRILRPIWRDPRIHYAVNCASIGCPNLRAEAYRAARLEEQLDDAARTYINHPRGVRLSHSGLVVSSLYSWYESDFGGNEAGVLAHLRGYAAPALAETLLDVRDIAGYEYDWALNGADR